MFFENFEYVNYAITNCICVKIYEFSDVSVDIVKLTGYNLKMSD